MTQLAGSLRHRNHWLLTLACLGALACNNAPNDADHESMGGTQATGGATQGGSTPVAAGGSTTTTKSPGTGTGTGGHGYTTTNPLPLGGAPAEGGNTSGLGGTSNLGTTASTGGVGNSAGTESTHALGGGSGSAGSSGIAHTGGASGHVGIGGNSNQAGAAGVAAGAANSTTQAPCGGPSYSNDCSKVPHIQCGPSVTCDGTTLKLQWHEHVMCPRPGSSSVWDNIFHYSCSYPCAKAACEALGSWPSSGSVIAQACQVGS